MSEHRSPVIQRLRRQLAGKVGWLTLAAGSLLAVLSRSISPLLISLALLVLHRARATRRQAVRRLELERDYAPFLISLASAVRTGLDPLVALSRTHEIFQPESVIATEILAFNRLIEAGVPEREAIERFCSSVPHPDLALFRLTFGLSREHGASLADSLQRLARVTRQRESFRRRTRAALAMQKVSALGIVACAVLTCGFQALSQPDALRDALDAPVGRICLSTGIALVALGVYWLFSLARREEL